MVDTAHLVTKFNFLKSTGYVMHQQAEYLNNVRSAHTVFMFCISLRTNSDLCHLQHKMIGVLTEMKVFTARYGLGI
jgi:hypothetical protein